MAVITPQTDLYLLKVPLEMNDINQLTFANATAQHNYFNGLQKIGFDDFTYQRKDGTIRVPALYDDIINYNYVMYRNDAYSNKWFYAFIEGMEYLNDNVTIIKIKSDVFQCWQFDLNYKRTFVEREHVNDDTPGIHTVPEGLELGEYEIVDLRDSPLWNDWTPCFCATKLPGITTNLQDNGRIAHDNGFIGGVSSSLHFFATDNIPSGIRKIIEYYEEDQDVTSDAIVNIYMIPTCCVNTTQTVSSYSQLHSYTLYPIYNFYETDTYQLQQPQVMAGNYYPVNKKLLSYPFSYFYVTNKAGEDVEFRYEDFPFENVGGTVARTMTYKKKIVPSTSLSAKLYFTKYKDYQSDNTEGTQMYNYGVNYGKIPVCAWTTDYYTNWLTQNGVNVNMNTALGIIGGALNTGVSIAGGDPRGASMGVLSIASTISNAIGEVHRAKTTPPQANGDINTGDFHYCFQRNSISFYEMSIRPEMARIIDGYFSMYGYRVNQVKVPNITGRRNWNYVKTIGCYIEADIPQDDLNEIKLMFDKGITLWHNPATFADYSQNNDII